MNKRKGLISRRDFISKGVSGSLFLGLGCPAMFVAGVRKNGNGPETEIHKFESEINFTYEKLFKFTFGGWFIDYMKRLKKEIGDKKFTKLLTKTGDEHYREGVRPRFKKIKDRSVQSLIENFWESVKNSKFGNSTITIEILDKAKEKGTVKMTECLFAKTFRENNAGDIGYAAICHADFAVVEEFNPDMVMDRDKCLMNGDECCLFKYSMKKG